MERIEEQGGDGPDDGTEASGRVDALTEGRRARSRLPRSGLAEVPDGRRHDPVEVLVEQGRGRVPELLGIRYARMLASPFAFFRGAAAVMAADLGRLPSTGLQAQLCGDAHLGNFGGFAAPDRTMVVDLNDFDETAPGPFEWDLRRLVASVSVAARDRGMPRRARRDLVHGCVMAYRDAMAEFATMTRLDVWYERLDAEAVAERHGADLGSSGLRRFDKAVARARQRTSSKAFGRYVQRDRDGDHRLVSAPPLLVPLEDLFSGSDLELARRRAAAMFDTYLSGLQEDRRWLVQGYRLVGVSRKVVGVGSVGTRCWVALLAAHDDEADCLVVQVKEARPSVLAPHLDPPAPTWDCQGERVVAGQRLMQATGDPLLGSATAEGLDGEPRDYYFRQLWDWKMSLDLEQVRPAGLQAYVKVCGWTLARAHARSGDRRATAAYLGSGRAAAAALVDFAEDYADINARDHARLVAAADDGLVPVSELR